MQEEQGKTGREEEEEKVMRGGVEGDEKLNVQTD